MVLKWLIKIIQIDGAHMGDKNYPNESFTSGIIMQLHLIRKWIIEKLKPHFLEPYIFWSYFEIRFKDVLSDFLMFDTYSFLRVYSSCLGIILATILHIIFVIFSYLYFVAS